jgi:hypothetical protein
MCRSTGIPAKAGLRLAGWSVLLLLWAISLVDELGSHVSFIRASLAYYGIRVAYVPILFEL